MPAFAGHTTGRADFRHPAFRLASSHSPRRRRFVHASKPQHLQFAEDMLPRELFRAAPLHFVPSAQEVSIVAARLPASVTLAAILILERVGPPKGRCSAAATSSVVGDARVHFAARADQCDFDHVRLLLRAVVGREIGPALSTSRSFRTVCKIFARAVASKASRVSTSTISSSSRSPDVRAGFVEPVVALPTLESRMTQIAGFERDQLLLLRTI